jgi:hypothetical protein
VKIALSYLPISPLISLFSSRPFKSTTTSPVTTHHSVYETALLKKLCMNTSVAHFHQHKRWKTLLNHTEATNSPNWRTRAPFAFSRLTCSLRSMSVVLQKGSICEVVSTRRTHEGLQVLKIFYPKYQKEALGTDDMTPFKWIIETGQKGWGYGPVLLYYEMKNDNVWTQ